MAVLDFREIPEGRPGTADPDAFELFCRDFLKALGFDILTGPSRGPDGGRDIVCEESREGPFGRTAVRWLVSCKHFAHSGRSVTAGDEESILDRVRANACTAFMGLYSTLPSTPLMTRVENLRKDIEARTFDHEEIEGLLLSRARLHAIAQRYFPASVATWRRENPVRAEIRFERTPVVCASCGKDLLDPLSGIVLFAHGGTIEAPRILAVRTACKGDCDGAVEDALDAEFEDFSHTGWEDIPDFCIPTIFLWRVLGAMSNLAGERPFTPQAFVELRLFLGGIFPYVARELTTKEQKAVDAAMRIPFVLGGLGEP